MLDGWIAAEREAHRAADHKAGLAAAGLVPTVAAATVAGAWARLPAAAAVPAWTGAALAVTALVLLGLAVWPRLRREATVEPADLRAAAAQHLADPAAAAEDRSAELARLRAITRRKFALTRWAIGLIGAAATAAATAVVIAA
ncbi:hypothetical protein STBA_71750 [Streptomyces sp. MP131-18]|nr:hypothetical protein STBA_71750 [Streptomyces sp. MP131-18]